MCVVLKKPGSVPRSSEEQKEGQKKDRTLLLSGESNTENPRGHLESNSPFCSCLSSYS